MITVDQLKKWDRERQGKSDERFILEEKIETYIDNEIKRQFLKGHNTLSISTGYYTPESDQKSDFYNLWCNESISQNELYDLRSKIIEKYKSIGIIINAVGFDEGFNSVYEGLWIEIPDELLNEE